MILGSWSVKSLLFWSERTKMNLNEICKYQQPSEKQKVALQNVRDGARLFMEAILANCLPCADRTAALRLAREAMMTANCAVVLDPSWTQP
jgi:hypothetical protein